MPYTEVLGIVGGIALPLITKNKWANYLGKFLTGMGANGMAKVFDPPNAQANVQADRTRLEKKEKSEIEKLLEVY